MPRFKESMYEPIEAEIGGKVYPIRTPLNSTVLDKCVEYEKLALEGDGKANYKLLNYLFGTPLSILNKTDVRVIRDLIKFINESIVNPSPVKAEEKKN